MDNRYLVEFFGTLILSFIIFATNNYLAIGAVLALAVFMGGAISGGAFNPAIAIAMVQAGKLATDDLMPYIVAQVGGALAGYQLVKSILSRSV
jgi:glycerol uptake facilitator-like aquaporin